jgi:fibronectin type 3 domain-containing protein
MAQYPSNPNPQTGAPSGISPWSSWSFWQYSSTGSVSGVPSTNCDKDVFNGTSAELQTWQIMSAPTAPTSPANNANVTGSPAMLDWPDVIGASSYSVFVDGVQKATGLTSSDWTVSPSLSNATHNWYIKATNNSGTVTSSTWSFTVQPSTALLQPTNFQITGATSNALTMSWTDNATGEAYYLIERKTGAAGTYGQIASAPANSISFTDNSSTDPLDPPQPGVTYYYRIRAYDGASSFSAYSSEATGTTYAAIPANVAASDGTFTDRIDLTWDVSAGAVGYQIYRSTTNNPAGAAALDTTTTNTYDDTTAVAGTTYFYFVAAQDSLNRLSAKGGGDSGYRAVPPAITGTSFGHAQAGTPVMFSFNTDVSQSLDVSDLTVTRLDTSETITPSDVTFNGDTYTASFWLPALADANYQAVLNIAGVSDTNGNHPSSAPPVDFFYLVADANRDRTVDLTDFTILASNFNGSGKAWSDGDFNYDATVDLTDFTLLASRFNATLSPPPAPPAATEPLALRSPGVTLFADKPVAVDETSQQLHDQSVAQLL